RRRLLFGILPDPVTELFVEHFFARHATLVLFVPANRVKLVLPAIRTAVFVRLAGERVIRQLRNKLRRECVQFVWKLSICQTEPFQGTGERSLIHGGLGYGSFEGYLVQGGHQQRRNEAMMQQNIERLPEV